MPERAPYLEPVLYSSRSGAMAQSVSAPLKHHEGGVCYINARQHSHLEELGHCGFRFPRSCRIPQRAASLATFKRSSQRDAIGVILTTVSQLIPQGFHVRSGAARLDDASGVIAPEGAAYGSRIKPRCFPALVPLCLSLSHLTVFSVVKYAQSEVCT